MSEHVKSIKNMYNWKYTVLKDNFNIFDDTIFGLLNKTCVNSFQSCDLNTA